MKSHGGLDQAVEEDGQKGIHGGGVTRLSTGRSRGAGPCHAPRQSRNAPKRSALGAGEAALDPVYRLHARGRIHAFGGEALDVVQNHHLLGRSCIWCVFRTRSRRSPDGRRQASSNLVRRANPHSRPFMARPSSSVDGFFPPLAAIAFSTAAASSPGERLRPCDRRPAPGRRRWRASIALQQPIVERRFRRHQAVGAARAEDGAVGHLVAQRSCSTWSAALNTSWLTLRQPAGRDLQDEGLQIAAPQAGMNHVGRRHPPAPRFRCRTGRRRTSAAGPSQACRRDRACPAAATKSARAVLAPGVILVDRRKRVHLDVACAFMYLMRPTLSIVACAAVRNT